VVADHTRVLFRPNKLGIYLRELGVSDRVSMSHDDHIPIALTSCGQHQYYNSGTQTVCWRESNRSKLHLPA
jgi:hypothetical protein